MILFIIAYALCVAIVGAAFARTGGRHWGPWFIMLIFFAPLGFLVLAPWLNSITIDGDHVAVVVAVAFLLLVGVISFKH